MLGAYPTAFFMAIAELVALGSFLSTVPVWGGTQGRLQGKGLADARPKCQKSGCFLNTAPASSGIWLQRWLLTQHSWWGLTRGLASAAELLQVWWVSASLPNSHHKALLVPNPFVPKGEYERGQIFSRHPFSNLSLICSAWHLAKLSSLSADTC